MKIAVTVDLENDLGFLESSFGIDEGMPVLLALLERHGIRGTFFVSGSCLERLTRGGLSGELVRLGHEIASHGLSHLDYRGWPRQRLLEEVRRSKELIEEAFGLEVLGYRAPQFLIDAPYLEALKECGFRYDSSFPDPRGIGAARLRKMRVGRELSLAVERLGLHEFVVDSVPYLRVPHGLLWVNALTPALYRRLFPGFQRELALFYLHPFDLIRDKGRVPLDLKRRAFYLRNGDRAAELLEDLVSFWKQRQVSFVRLADLLPVAKEST